MIMASKTQQANTYVLNRVFHRISTNDVNIKWIVRANKEDILIGKITMHFLNCINMDGWTVFWQLENNIY